MPYRLAFLLAAMLLLAACAEDPSPRPAAPDDDAVPDSVQARVEQTIAAIDAMRSQLAATIEDEQVDAETFARVCKPVGMRAQEVNQQTDWTVQQLAVRYRNPANAPDSLAAIAHERFETDPALTDYWIEATRDGQAGMRYFRRITVEASCLACHGAEDDRPAFVQANYPEDRAYGFDAGDLRGVYAAFVPAASH
ncbi:MAG: DUF3365 domain-containing protein [Bacteroidetes bacterium]|jgi:hypothetical protein|nr:DUF3365 domain-containing protein [Bacteroidota bacterium]